MKFPNFCGPSYLAVSGLADAEDLINRYPEVMEVPGAKTRIVLPPAPGFRPFVTVDHFPVRGLFAQNDQLFTVADNVLYEIFSNGTTTARGSLLTNDGSPVTICSNGVGGDQLFLTSSSKGFLYDLNTHVLTQVLAQANFGGFLSGWFVALDVPAGHIRVSDVEDGSVWSANQFAARTQGGDAMKALAATRTDLWVFGSQTAEIWYPAGGSFPFAEKLGAFMNHGISAPYSIAVVDNAPMWLSASESGSGIVLRAGDGNVPQRVSTHALERAIQGYATIADAIGWTYQAAGHSFYILTFPTAGVTWAYDAAASLQLGFPCWHKRGYWHGAAWQRMKGQFHAFAFGKHLVGDRTTGTIYEMSEALATDEDGIGMRRVRVAPHLPTENKQLFISALELDVDVGGGLVAGQGSDPLMMCRFSRDGTKTWGRERTASVGKIGAYDTRVRWGPFPAARRPVFEVADSEPVRITITDALLEAAAGLT